MLKAGICQLAVEDDKRKNMAKARRMIRQAAAAGCELVVLPEMFNCPYQNEYFSVFAESFPDGETLQMLSEAAAAENILLVGGSIPELDEGHIYNTSFIFDETGQLLGRHRKVHLFDVDIKGGTVFRESDTLSAGDKPTVFTWHGLKIGVAICYDIRFPEFARLMTDMGAQLLIYPAAFGTVTGPAHWRLLVRGRAADNQVFVIGAAPACTPGAKYQAYGHSIVADSWGNILTEAEAEEGVFTISLDLAFNDKVRAELPLLRHRRKGIDMP